ncbi:MAG: glycosyl transferase family 2 [Paracoccus denitrificans]|nr:MAG: glycosyl transferase family 2 [Paracoccus denitrificans]PZO83974.1 MAG: glycosyl transferase family 2 [Paracoccus denitrificans]
MSRPHILICMATYNGEGHIRAQLDSLAAQDWTDWRLIVSDDGSTDRTLKVVLDFADDLPGGKVQVAEGPRQGATQNFLSLLRHAGPDDWVAWCDQDDVWKPDRLSRGVTNIAPLVGPAITASRTVICDARLRPLTDAPLYARPAGFRNALVQACVPGNTTLMNPPALRIMQEGAAHARAAGVISHDWWAYLLLSGAGAHVIRDPATTVFYRQHGDNEMGRNDTWRARLDRLRRLGAGEYGTWLHANLQALRACRDMLTADAIAVMDEFAQAVEAPGPIAVRRLMRLGVYRQTRAGTMALMAAATAGRLRGERQ